MIVDAGHSPGSLPPLSLSPSFPTSSLLPPPLQVAASPSAVRKMNSSKDRERLREIFFQLQECKDDSQQRGWAVHDDQHAIMEYLEELLQILVRVWRDGMRVVW